MNYLILVRHGLSMWNLTNKFSGWVDMPLSERGVLEAQLCAEDLKALKIDVAYTSELRRAQQTLLTILSKQNRTGIFLHRDTNKHNWLQNSNKFDKNEIPVYCSMALNERYYGELQGMDKDEARRKFGEKNVLAWRRGYADKPPHGESLKDVYNRCVPYFRARALKDVTNGKNVIVCAHGNTLRAIIKNLENISDEKIVSLEFPMARPIIYKTKGESLERLDNGLSFDRKVYWEKM